ncbi:MAG: hypothetical protein MUC99_10635 [Anaerolineae bacterium]|nr:hypothetical protein [Anaerolineae bacterium]
MGLAELAALFAFSPDDLTDNRAGRLSAGQHARLSREAVEACLGALSMLVVLPWVAVVAVSYFIVAIRFGDALGPWVCGVFLLFFALVAVLLTAGATAVQRIARRWVNRPDCGVCRWLGTRFYPHTVEALALGRVVMLAGRWTLESDGEHEVLLLDGQPLEADVLLEQDERVLRLADGGAYRVYCVPRVWWVVAAEPLGEAVQPPAADG